MRNFLAALSFLTRLGPALRHGPELFASALPWYPFVGLVVGLFCVLPFYSGLFSAHPLVQAWIYIVLNFWITRGLHFDGLADLADAWGSGAQGDKFRQILYDSRCGAFGAMGLVLVLAGYMALAYSHITAGQLAGLVLAPVFGRAVVPPLAAMMRPHNPSSLGGLVFAGAGPKLGLACLFGIFILAVSAFSTLKAFAMLAMFIAIMAGLVCLARKNGGGNGDFLGCAIVLCELAALLCSLP